MQDWLAKSIRSFIVLSLAFAFIGCGDDTEEIDAKLDQSDDLKPLVSIVEVNSVTWLGDSITHHAEFTQYLETFFVTRFPQREWQFYNRGVAGDRAADALARITDDPTASGVQLTVVQLGMNDGGYRRWREQTGELFEKDLRSLIEKILMSGGGAVLVSPTAYDVEAEWRDQLRDGEPLRTEDRGLLEYDTVIDKLSGISSRIADDRSLGFVDVRNPLLEGMREERQRDRAFSLVTDSLHPSADGHAIMAVTILRTAFFASEPLNEVVISKANDGTWRSEAVGAELQDLVVVERADATPRALSFLLTSEALPWLVPDDAKSGFSRAGGDEVNREKLRISDLEPGSYLLSIESFVAGTFTAEELAEGIDVGAISGTPQRVQAAAVTELNRERNQGPVRSRQDWQADLKNRRAALAAMEEGADKQDAQTEFDLWLETHRQALTDLEAKDKKLWSAIREAAQPVELRYELRRLPEGYRAFATD